MRAGAKRLRKGLFICALVLARGASGAQGVTDAGAQDPFTGGQSFPAGLVAAPVPEECHEPSGEKPGSNQFELGTSSSYTTQGAIDDEVTGDCRFLHARAPGVGSLDTAVARTGPHSVRITMTGVGVDNPLVNPSCSIDWHAEVEIDESDPDHPVVRARGTHDAFPNHELFVNGQPLHLHHGQYIWTLCGLFPVEFDTGWVPLPTT